MQHYHLPLESARKALGLGLLTFKKWYSHHGMAQWPYRKVSSVDLLIADIKEKDAQGQLTSCEPLMAHLAATRWVWAVPRPEVCLSLGLCCCDHVSVGTVMLQGWESAQRTQVTNKHGARVTCKHDGSPNRLHVATTVRPLSHRDRTFAWPDLCILPLRRQRIYMDPNTEIKEDLQWVRQEAQDQQRSKRRIIKQGLRKA